MGVDSPPTEEWLRQLGVRHWLQIPPRDRQSNSTQTMATPDFCQVWPLDTTGSVEVYFQPGVREHPPEIHLRPWLAMPRR